MAAKIQKIDYSRKRLATQADKYYNDGRFVDALRTAHREYALYGGDGEVYARIADIYEAMGLHASAINYLFRYLDIADEEDYPDIYEGIAVNYMNIGNESAAAFYYNRLIDVDDTLTPESKMEIAAAFTKEKKSNLRFAYPSELADFSKELESGTRAMKSGDFPTAIDQLERVEEGSKQYAEAQETLAVAYLLADDMAKAEEVCLRRLEETPNDPRLLSTLAAVYMEGERKEESLAVAKKLCTLTTEDHDEIYKIATVCCENGLHEEAYERFCRLDEALPYDGRTLYFKAVSAYKCGKKEEAERTLDLLCTIYPDAEVAKFYLHALRNDEEVDFDYFYRVPQDERNLRTKALLMTTSASKDEAAITSIFARENGAYAWAFDEMDGNDVELQYLALVAAVRAEEDDFVRDVLLDYEVSDMLKIETMCLLYERNREDEVGFVMCNVCRKVHLLPVRLGRKRRKIFIEGYAKVASKFGIASDECGERVVAATETLYRTLEANGCLETVKNADDCACAVFLTSGIKDVRGEATQIAALFGADIQGVQAILTAALGKGEPQETEKEANEDEID